ncbi:MAG: ribonuclease III [Rhodospirillales bacterium]|nr:ribonuclease III [Rhodospirillales bacterium]
MGNTLDRLEAVIGYQFVDRELLVEALTHSSLAKNHSRQLASNERLEFLGDRVVGLIVSRMLFERFPHEDEGALARRHAELVRKETLSRVAESLGLARFLRLSRGEEDAGGRKNPAILADAMEAVLAAVYLDGGLTPAEHLIRAQWRGLIEEDLTPPKDAKTGLQEWAQARSLPLPEYREVSREGPPHAPVFSVEVAVRDIEPQTAVGPSKRAAEQAAARALLDRLEAERDA